jgi:predicted anti-sigma-YlaC factor YlaD
MTPPKEHPDVLNYAAGPSAQRRHDWRWWLMTVSGWLLAIVGGVALSLYVGAGAFLLLGISRDWAMGGIAAGEDHILWRFGLGVAMTVLMLLAGVLLLLRRRRLR